MGENIIHVDFDGVAHLTSLEDGAPDGNTGLYTDTPFEDCSAEADARFAARLAEYVEAVSATNQNFPSAE